MSYFRYSVFLSLSLSLSGCAVTSGLQTYDLPAEGSFQTELGTTVNLIKINQENLPALKIAETNLNEQYAHLFNQQQAQYRLASGDILSIYLWAYPEITPPTNTMSNLDAIQSNGYRIDQQGYIQFPIIGRYKAAGKTLDQVNQELRSKLAKYLKTPDVVARVLSYQGQRFSVQGNVNKAGQFYLNDQPVSLYTALGMAGGVNTQTGDNASIRLVRQGQTYHLNTLQLERAGFSLHQLLMQPNDTLYVSSRENQKIYMMGESNKNQAIPLREQGMTLSDVLGESLGLNSTSGSRSKIYIVRGNSQTTGTQIYHLDLTSIGDFGLANQFQMRSNDIVYIDASGLARWQRVVSQVMPFSSMIYNLDRIGQ